MIYWTKRWWGNFCDGPLAREKCVRVLASTHKYHWTDVRSTQYPELGTPNSQIFITDFPLIHAIEPRRHTSRQGKWIRNACPIVMLYNGLQTLQRQTGIGGMTAVAHHRAENDWIKITNLERKFGGYWADATIENSKYSNLPSGRWGPDNEGLLSGGTRKGERTCKR